MTVEEKVLAVDGSSKVVRTEEYTRDSEWLTDDQKQIVAAEQSVRERLHDLRQAIVYTTPEDKDVITMAGDLSAAWQALQAVRSEWVEVRNDW